MADTKLTLGYWNGPGKAQATRYVLELAGVEFNNVTYTNPADWFGRDKAALGLPFPNLPYIIDGEVKLTESEALFDYAVHKTNQPDLLGKGNDKFTVTTIRNVLSEVGTKIYLASIATAAEEKAKIINEQIVPKLNYVKAFLGNKEWTLGYLSAADIYLAGAVKGFKTAAPEVYAEHFAAAFDPVVARFNELPNIKAYLASGRYAW